MKRIKRVFVANRGEIALRIVNACEELGLETVVGTSDADRDGLAARRADRAVCIGPAPAAESYLRDDLVVQAALGTGCDAIHPGYGFLSESPRLAAARERQRARLHRPTARGHGAERRQAPRARGGGPCRASRSSPARKSPPGDDATKQPTKSATRCW